VDFYTPLKQHAEQGLPIRAKKFFQFIKNPPQNAKKLDSLPLIWGIFVQNFIQETPSVQAVPSRTMNYCSPCHLSLRFIRSGLVGICLLFHFSVTAFSDKPAKPRYTKDLLALTQWFTGDFDNTKQCKVDTAARPVESHVVKIWENYFSDAVYLYEEFQSPPGQVVSQKIYKFMDYTAGRFEAKVYTLPGMEDYAGEYKNIRPFEQFSPENLEDHPSCVVYFVRKGETKFSGSTVGQDCQLGRKNQKYVTSQFDVYPTRVSRVTKVFGWENEQISGPVGDQKGDELRRTVPPKPKKVRKAPAPKKSSTRTKSSTSKTGSKSKSKSSKKAKSEEVIQDQTSESDQATVEPQAKTRRSFWDRFKRKPKDSETAPEEGATGN
jgi:hypothetical protein